MKTALILSGGGTRGAIEFGACKVILSRIRPDFIIGTSVGSLNAAAITDGPDIAENLKRIEAVWLMTKRETLFPLNREFFYRLTNVNSVFSNKGLYTWLRTMIKARDFKELSLPLYVNCTDLFTGESVMFSEGELIEPLVASCSAIPLLPPVIIGGKPYVDGALSSIFGIRKAIELKCTKVILVDVERNKAGDTKFKSIRDYFDYAWILTKNQNIRNEIEICRDRRIKIIEVTPELSSHDIVPISFDNVADMIRQGEETARTSIKEFR